MAPAAAQNHQMSSMRWLKVVKSCYQNHCFTKIERNFVRYHDGIIPVCCILKGCCGACMSTWLISWNHAHGRLFQYFSSNGCFLHFTHKSLPRAVFRLQKKSCHHVPFREIMHMRGYSETSAQTDVGFIFRLNHYRMLYYWSFWMRFYQSAIWLWAMTHCSQYRDDT